MTNRIGLIGWSFLALVLSGCERQPAPSSSSSAEASATATSVASEDGLEGFCEPATTAPAVEPSRTSVATSDQVPSFQPLRQATVGQRVQYACLRDQMIQYAIIEATETFVTVETRVYDHQLLVGLPSLRKEPRSLDPLERQASHRRCTRQSKPALVQAASRQFRATLYEDTWSDEAVQYTRRTWVSPEVPIYGIVRMELLGDGQVEARMELLGDGRGGTQ